MRARSFGGSRHHVHGDLDGEGGGSEGDSGSSCDVLCGWGWEAVVGHEGEAGALDADGFSERGGGGYAAPTPCTDGKQVFVAFGSAVMAALDMEGNIVWRRICCRTRLT